MASTNRIDIGLLDDSLKGLINASTKIFPMNYADISANLNPNNYEYGRVIDDTVHKDEIYHWDVTWHLIGADDHSVDWTELKNKPSSYPPSAHTHTVQDITDISQTYATQTDLSNKADVTALDSKVDKVAGMGLSTNDYTTDEKNKLASLTNSATMDYDTMNQNLQNHIDNTTVHITSTERTSWNGKVDSTTFTGHAGNTTIHVTQSDKDVWNAKSNFSGSYDDLTNKPTIPSKTSQLTNDRGFLTSAPDEITVGTTQPTSNLWYKVVG